MYRWYWNADICYVFLDDVPSDTTLSEWEDTFVGSRWFQRGWTLQELLAPPIVEFYGSKSETRLGTKSKFQSAIERSTGIHLRYLQDRDHISNATIGTKFRWASRRTTTRPEDMAYCLLGLFGIHMPMLYGEGERAFYRLQLEIIKESSDHSIFTWGEIGSWSWDFGLSRRIGPGDPDQYVLGMFASSPNKFENLSSSRQALQESSPTGSSSLRWSPTSEMTNRGLRIGLPCINWSAKHPFNGPVCQGVTAILRGVQYEGNAVGIQLIRLSEEENSHLYARLPGSSLIIVPTTHLLRASLLQIYIVAESKSGSHSQPSVGH